MTRGTLVVAAGVVLGAGAWITAQHDEKHQAVRVLSVRDIAEKLDGQKAKATMVEVTLAPGEVEAAHRHPGPAFGYILEGEYEWAIDGNKPKVFKAGDSFYEPTGCLHDVGRNPSKKNKTRFVALVLHPADAKDIVIPEKAKK